MIAYLTPDDRQQVIGRFNDLPDAEEGQRGIGLVDFGMREVVERMNTISPNLVVFSSCTGHVPPVVPKGTVPGHLVFWLARGWSGLPDEDLAQLVCAGLSSVSRELVKYGDRVRPLLEFRWQFHRFEQVVPEIELALRRWFPE